MFCAWFTTCLRNKIFHEYTYPIYLIIRWIIIIRWLRHNSWHRKDNPVGKDYDPAMHSAEHMLNQTMVRMFQCGRCVNAHVEKRKSRLDYRFNRDLTRDEVSEIERRMNEIILSDLPVIEEFLSRGEAEQQFHLGKLPSDSGDRIRIIRIGNYDACPCIGMHVRTTKEIGEFRIVSTSYQNGLLRLRYKLNHRGEIVGE